jgi:acylphosphatase
LQGWVRNLRSGAVESVFAGAPDAVAAMLEACREGPRGSQVDAVQVTEADEAALASCRPGELFSVLATA